MKSLVKVSLSAAAWSVTDILRFSAAAPEIANTDTPIQLDIRGKPVAPMQPWWMAWPRIGYRTDDL
jgi:hypothetical protein